MDDLDVSLSKIMEEKNKVIGENAILDKGNFDRIGK